MTQLCDAREPSNLSLDATWSSVFPSKTVTLRPHVPQHLVGQCVLSPV